MKLEKPLEKKNTNSNRICPTCNTQFVRAKGTNRIHCSQKCQWRYHNAKSREKHFDKLKAYSKKYYQKNKERIKVKNNKRYWEKREQLLPKKRKHYYDNKERILKKNKKRYGINKNKILVDQKKYYEKNKERISEREKQKYQKNKDKIKQKIHNYYHNNKKLIHQKNRLKYHENREEILAKQKEDYHNNPEKYAKKRKRYYQNFREKENFRRKELGLPLIGEGWLHEARLGLILKSIFPNQTIIHLDRSTLVDLELDYFLPEPRIAFEYNGIQHYHFRKRFHETMEKFKEQQKRDKEKIIQCREFDIKLIIIKYNDPLTEEYVLKKLKQKIIKEF